MGTPKIAPFPSIRPYSLLHIAHQRPDPRPRQHLCPPQQPGTPYPRTPAAPTGRFVSNNSAAAAGRQNRRARRPNSPQQLLLRSFRMRVFHQPVPLLSGAWFYSTSTTSLAFIFRGEASDGAAKARRWRRKRQGGGLAVPEVGMSKRKLLWIINKCRVLHNNNAEQPGVEVEAGDFLFLLWSSCGWHFWLMNMIIARLDNNSYLGRN